MNASKFGAWETLKWTPPGERFSMPLRYGVAVGAVGLALLVRLALDSLIGREIQPYITIYFAAALMAWWAGPRPALFTLFVGLLCCLWIVVPPRNSLVVRGLEDLVEILICLLVSVTIISLVVVNRVTSVAKRQSEAARQQLAFVHRETRLILESISDAFTSLNRQWTYTYVNRAAGLLLRRDPADLVGKNFWEQWPQMRVLPYGAQFSRALAENVTVQLEAFWPEPVNAWLEVRCYPSPEGLSLFLSDITGRRQAQEALLEAKEILATRNQQLQRIVNERTEELEETLGELQLVSYALAHDMRAPLRAMSGYASMLGKEHSSSADCAARELCARIARGAERLDKLIVDALSYTKSLHDELPIGAVDLSELLRELLESYPDLQPHAARIRTEESLPWVFGNKAALTQCFSNLLGNGVKFVAPGVRPELRIWAETRGSRVRVWVQDNGVGIAKEHQERIFNLFEQLNPHLGGTGIGLAVVRKTVQRMGGATGVESKLGHGSRFWVELPSAHHDG
jgi:signal transduction histidine kinase